MEKYKLGLKILKHFCGRNFQSSMYIEPHSRFSDVYKAECTYIKK